jgi:hypothetical protein
MPKFCSDANFFDNRHVITIGTFKVLSLEEENRVSSHEVRKDASLEVANRPLPSH